MFFCCAHSTVGARQFAVAFEANEGRLVAEHESDTTQCPELGTQFSGLAFKHPSFAPTTARMFPMPTGKREPASRWERAGE